VQFILFSSKVVLCNWCCLPIEGEPLRKGEVRRFVGTIRKEEAAIPEPVFEVQEGVWHPNRPDEAVGCYEKYVQHQKNHEDILSRKAEQKRKDAEDSVKAQAFLQRQLQIYKLRKFLKQIQAHASRLPF
jgi:hypothetical protein